MSGSIQNLGSNLAALSQSRGRESTEMKQQAVVGTSNLSGVKGQNLKLESNLDSNRFLGDA